MGKLTMTRRTFAKLSAATAAAATVGAASYGTALAENKVSQAEASEIKRIRSCCRGCGKMECGVWVYVQDGKVIRSEGDEAAFQSMGNHCSKGQASLQAAYHPDRLKYPMKRTNPKDSDDPGWQRITWDEAMDTIGSKFSELQSKYGNETYFSMAGTSRIWSMGPYAALKQCFVSPNAIQANEICKGPRFYATKLNDYNAYSWMEVVGRPRVYVQWGGASELSNYDDSCRTTVDVATRADFHILVDPRQTNLGKEADIWLPLRPGTDALWVWAGLTWSSTRPVRRPVRAQMDERSHAGCGRRGLGRLRVQLAVHARFEAQPPAEAVRHPGRRLEHRVHGAQRDQRRADVL